LNVFFLEKSAAYTRVNTVLVAQLFQNSGIYKDIITINNNYFVSMFMGDEFLANLSTNLKTCMANSRSISTSLRMGEWGNDTFTAQEGTF